MNSLEMKKRAFMAAVTRNYGFVRVKSGSLPLTLESCMQANLINYKISGNVGKNLFDKSKSPSGIASETEAKGVAGMALLNDEVRRIFKPSTTYTMIYDAEVTYVPNLDEYTLNPSSAASWIGFLLYSGKTGYVAVQMALAPVVEPVTQGTKYHVCKKFITPEKIDDTYGNYTMRFYARLYEKNSDGTRQNGSVKFTNIQILEGDYTGDNEPEYEPYKCVGDLDSASGKYKIPVTVSGENLSNAQTTNIFISAPLKIGESIEYKTDKLPDIALSDGTNIISVGTEVSPSAFEAEYYSNIEEE